MIFSIQTLPHSTYKSQQHFKRLKTLRWTSWTTIKDVSLNLHSIRTPQTFFTSIIFKTLETEPFLPKHSSVCISRKWTNLILRTWSCHAFINLLNGFLLKKKMKIHRNLSKAIWKSFIMMIKLIKFI